LFINALNNFPDDAYEVELKEFLEFVNPKEPVVSEVTQSLEPLKEEHIFENKSNSDEDLKMASEILENYHESDVDVKGVVKTDSFVERMIPILEKQNLYDLKEMQKEISSSKTHDFANYQEEVQHIEQIPTKSEVTWESIYNDWDNTSEFYTKTFLQYLEKNYNVPTKKQ
jgi:hypothetical protein